LPKEIKCPKCGQTLASKEEMTEHQKTHVNNSKEKLKPTDAKLQYQLGSVGY